MNTPQTAIIITCCAAFCAATAVASTVTESTSPSTLGVPYRWFVQMGGADNAAFSRHVGSWSWEDNTLVNPIPGEPPLGWTHQSDWLALILTDSATLTVRIERDANVPQPIAGDPGHLASIASMFPSFTIWSALDQDTTQSDSYNNRGNIAWAEDISYLDHVDNSTQTFVEESWVLSAGSYTFAIGSNSDATNLDRQGYRTILTTTIVPEPGAVLLLALGAFALGKRRLRAKARVFGGVGCAGGRSNVTVPLLKRLDIILDYRTPIRQNRSEVSPPHHHENNIHDRSYARRLSHSSSGDYSVRSHRRRRSRPAPWKRTWDNHRWNWW